MHIVETCIARTHAYSMVSKGICHSIREKYSILYGTGKIHIKLQLILLNYAMFTPQNILVHILTQKKEERMVMSSADKLYFTELGN